MFRTNTEVVEESPIVEESILDLAVVDIDGKEGKLRDYTAGHKLTIVVNVASK